jgi:hypothetical protein
MTPMQKIAAFLLERRDDLAWPEARQEEANNIKASVLTWLESKGAPKGVSEGSFSPEDNSEGSFQIQDAVDGDRSWWFLQLEEKNQIGQCFATALSITSGSDWVSVYITLEVGWTHPHIMPLNNDARCPKIVRSLLDLPGNWYLGSSVIRKLRRINGFDDGEALASEILLPDRSIPILAVSSHDGNVVLPSLDKKLADDLAGLANVVVIDKDASWALTDTLGSYFSCYQGSVRLYWPRFSLRQGRYYHPLWTYDRLRSNSKDIKETREQFRKQLRARIFRACALSVTRPREVDEIRDAVRQRPLKELRERAHSLEEYKELAGLYANENEALREDNKSLHVRIDELESDVSRLQFAKQSLQSHLSTQKESHDEGEYEEISPDPVSNNDENVHPPGPGEIRYYKKKFDTPSHDIMIRRPACGCNNWKAAHKADKAWKGVAKLEGGREDWKKFQHCASCTGGGMWKVTW